MSESLQKLLLRMVVVEFFPCKRLLPTKCVNCNAHTNVTLNCRKISWRKLGATEDVLEKLEFKHTLTPKGFDTAFPFHLVVDGRTLTVSQLGSVSA